MNDETTLRPGLQLGIILIMITVMLAVALGAYARYAKPIGSVEYALMVAEKASKTIDTAEKLEHMLLGLNGMYEEHKARYLENKYLDNLEAMAVTKEERELSNKIAAIYNEIFAEKNYLFLGETPDGISETLETLK